MAATITLPSAQLAKRTLDIAIGVDRTVQTTAGNRWANMVRAAHTTASISLTEGSSSSRQVNGAEEGLVFPLASRLDAVFLIWNATQPRSLMRMSAECDACVRRAAKAVAFVAVDVDRLRLDPVVHAHRSAGVSLMDRVTCNEFILSKAGELSIRTGSGATVRFAAFVLPPPDSADGVIQDIGEWLASLSIDPGTAVDRRVMRRFAQMWESAEDVGRSNARRAAQLSEWIAVELPTAPSTRVFFNRRTRDVTWTMPRVMMLQGCDVPSGDELARFMSSVQSASTAKVPHYVVAKAIATLQERQQEKEKSQASGNKPNAVCSSTRLTRRDKLQSECAQLRATTLQLKAEATERQSQIAALTEELSRLSTSVADAEAEENRLAAEIAVCTARITNLLAEKERIAALEHRLEQWPGERAARTAAYVAAWRANQQTRSQIKLIKDESAAIQKECECDRLTHLDQIDRRLRFLDQRITDIETATLKVWTVELPAAERAVCNMRVDLDKVVMDSGVSPRRSLPSVAHRIVAYLTGDKETALHCTAEVFRTRLMDLCDIGCELTRLATHRANLLRLQLSRSVSTTGGVPLFPVDKLICDMVLRDEQISVLMLVEHSVRIQLEHEARGELISGFVEHLAGVHRYASRALYSIRYKRQLLH